MRHSIGGLEDDEATVPSRDDGDGEMDLFHGNSSCLHSSEPTPLNELLCKLSIRHERSSLKSKKGFPSQPVSLTETLAAKSTKKKLRFATNSQTNQVWALQKQIEPIPDSLKKVLWWTKQELEDFYDSELEDTLLEVEASYKTALRTAYLSCKDPTTTESTVALCFAHMLDCQQARGLEAEVLPQLKHYKKKHRRAVLNACRASSRKLEETTITAMEWSFRSDSSESEGNEDEGSWDSHEEKLQEDTPAVVYHEDCWNEIRQESLKYSKPCRWVATKMGEYDHYAATVGEESPTIRRNSNRWATDEISDHSFSSDQDILSEALELVHHHPQPQQNQNCARPKRSSSIDESGAVATPSPPPVPSVSQTTHADLRPVPTDANKDNAAKKGGLRHHLLRRDSADLLQPEDRRILLRQDSSPRPGSSSTHRNSDTPLKVPQRLLSPDKQRRRKKLSSRSSTHRNRDQKGELPTISL